MVSHSDSPKVQVSHLASHSKTGGRSKSAAKKGAVNSVSSVKLGTGSITKSKRLSIDPVCLKFTDEAPAASKMPTVAHSPQVQEQAKVVVALDQPLVVQLLGKFKPLSIPGTTGVNNGEFNTVEEATAAYTAKAAIDDARLRQRLQAEAEAARATKDGSGPEAMDVDA